jgi:transaldolase
VKLFIDTANIAEIKEANEMGVICGVTTKPSLIAKEGRDFIEVIKEITDLIEHLISNHTREDTYLKTLKKKFQM